VRFVEVSLSPSIALWSDWSRRVVVRCGTVDYVSVCHTPDGRASEPAMNWFEQTFGFTEQGPDHVRAHLRLDGDTITSTVNGARVGCGRLTLPSLGELRASGGGDADDDDAAPSTLVEVVGDVAALHRDPANAGALFQAASQFNLLEMVSPRVTPDEGVGVYSYDRTQGPACAIACGGGTVYRNYFAPVAGGVGQTADRQIDALADLEVALGAGHWRMQNGYALATVEGLRAINGQLAAADDEALDRLRGMLRVGVQHAVQVLGTSHVVTQVYGSALPVAYGDPPAPLWEPFARLVLDASYEATLRIAHAEGIERVFLTQLGGGVFGNASAWIEDAIVRAVSMVPGLDVRLVSYGASQASAQRIVARCARPARAR